MYKFSDLEDQIDYLKNALNFLKERSSFGYDKMLIQQHFDSLTDLEHDLCHLLDQYEISIKAKYSMDTCSDDSLYMLEAIS